MSRFQTLSALALAAALGWGAAPSARAGEQHEWRLLDLGGGYLGVTLEDLGPDAARAAGLEEPRGARVVEVIPETPAGRAGLEAGDVIVAFDGEEVRSSAQLGRLVRETPPGRSVSLEVVRSGESVRLSAELEEGGLARLGRRIGPYLRRFDRDFQGFDFTLPDVDLRFHERRGARLGIRYQEIEDQLAGYFGVEGRGVLVTHVEDGSPAAKAGLRAGDVLQELGGRTIRDAGDLRHAMSRAERGEPVTLEVLRRGEPRALELILDDGEPAEKTETL